MSKEAAMAAATGASSQTPAQPASQTPTPQGSPSQAQGLPATQTPPDITAQRLALFAKKEAQLQTERQKIKADWEQKRQIVEQAQAYNKKWDEFSALKAKDPIAALKMAGFTETDLMNFVAEGTGEKDPAALAEEVAAKVEAKIDAKLNEKEQKLTAQQNQKLVSTFKTNIKTQLTKQADKFEYAAYEGPAAESLAYNFVVENLKMNPDEPLMSISEALELTDKYFQDKYKKFNERKAVPRGTDQAAAPQTQNYQTASNQTFSKPGRTRTLTNSVSATSQPLMQTKETKEQKRERLISALREGRVL